MEGKACLDGAEYDVLEQQREDHDAQPPHEYASDVEELDRAADLEADPVTSQQVLGEQRDLPRDAQSNATPGEEVRHDGRQQDGPHDDRLARPVRLCHIDEITINGPRALDHVEQKIGETAS